MDFLTRASRLRDSFTTLVLKLEVRGGGRLDHQPSARHVALHRHDAAANGEWRIWWQRPDKWRDDYSSDGAWTRHVAVGGKAATYVAGTGRLVVADSPVTGSAAGEQSFLSWRLSAVQILDERFLAEGWTFGDPEPTTWLNRKALMVNAKRAGMRPARSIGVPGIEAWRLVVDDATGIVLRAAGMIDGEVAFESRVTAIDTDGPIPDKVFSLDRRDLEAA